MAWQDQIFNSLDPQTVKKALSVEFKRVNGEIVPPAGVEVVSGEGPGGETVPIGYQKFLGDVNGLPVTASYDLEGNIKGYWSPFKYSSNGAFGNWDASGQAQPLPTPSDSSFFSGITDAARGAVNITKDLAPVAAKSAALYYGAQALGGAGAGAGAGTTGTTEGGLLSGAGSTGTGLQATGGLGLTGGNTANLAAMGGAQGLTTAGTTGATLGATGGALTAGGIGAGIGLSEVATGTGSLLGTGAAAGAAGGLTASQMAKAGLISGGLNLAGGLLQGKTSQDAANQLAAQQAALAEKTLQMGKFQPVGVTTRFGTSNFTTDPVTGAITPSYTLSPEAKAYQDALSGMATQSLTAGQGLMNLGQQYIGESPEAVRNRYIQTQQALLAPQQEQTLAALRNRQAATGRGGLAFGATSDGMMATNPEMAAYYNSLAQTQRQLAANAETQYQNQVNFGTGLLGGATTPFTNVFNTQKSVETAGQQPLGLATDFANTVATRGAAQGANYANAMSPSLQAQYNANNYNPYATTLQGLGNNRYFIDSNLVSGNV